MNGVDISGLPESADAAIACDISGLGGGSGAESEQPVSIRVTIAMQACCGARELRTVLNISKLSVEFT